VVALADMPFIDPGTIAAVTRALQGGARIAAPVFRASGARGHPVGFSASLAGELTSLRGDGGARPVIERFRDEFVAVPTDDRGVLADIDRRDDIDRHA
jgi:molybdenum cofactor cytidylyltransferase